MLLKFVFNFNISLISYKKSNVYMFVFATTNENSTLQLEFEIWLDII